MRFNSLSKQVNRLADDLLRDVNEDVPEDQQQQIQQAFDVIKSAFKTQATKAIILQSFATLLMEWDGDEQSIQASNALISLKSPEYHQLRTPPVTPEAPRRSERTGRPTSRIDVPTFRKSIFAGFINYV
jgi:hypothetical protein